MPSGARAKFRVGVELATDEASKGELLDLHQRAIEMAAESPTVTP